MLGFKNTMSLVIIDYLFQTEVTKLSSKTLFQMQTYLINLPTVFISTAILVEAYKISPP